MIEGWAVAGTVIGSGNGTPVIIRPNRTTTVQFPHTGGIEGWFPSSTSTPRQRFTIVPEAADNTDATRKYRAIFNAYDTDPREAFRIVADGSRGYAIFTLNTTAPADALLPNNSIAFYRDSADVKCKAKDGSGTVTTATLGTLA